jgi:phosphoglycerate dehydrogenase-like enzyme
VQLLFLGHVWHHYRAALQDRLGGRNDLSIVGSVSDPVVLERVEKAHVIVTNALPSALGRAANVVRLIQAGGAGVNKIDMDSVPAGVPLCRTGHHGPSIAEHVLMVMLALQRNLLGLDRELRAGRWRNAAYDPQDALQSTMDGKTVVVLGTGEIGSHVAARCRPLGLRVIGVNRRGLAQKDSGFDEVRPWTALDETLPGADFLVVAVPLTDETHGAIDARRLGLMNPQAYLIAVSRGPVIDEAALFAVLQRRRIAGAAIDVWYRYPGSPGEMTRPSSLPFERLPNVIMTPHSSGMTAATFDRRIDDIVDNIVRLEHGEPLHGIVAVGERRQA